MTIPARLRRSIWMLLAAALLGAAVAAIAWIVSDGGDGPGPVTPTTTSPLTPVTTTTAPPDLVTVPPSTDLSTAVDRPAEPINCAVCALGIVTSEAAEAWCLAHCDDADGAAEDCSHSDGCCHHIHECETGNPVACAWLQTHHCCPDIDCGEPPPDGEPAADPDLHRCLHSCEDTIHCGSARADSCACSYLCRAWPDDPSKWTDCHGCERLADDDDTSVGEPMCDPIPDGSADVDAPYRCRSGGDCATDGQGSACECWCCLGTADCIEGHKCCCPCVHNGQFCDERARSRGEMLGWVEHDDGITRLDSDGIAHTWRVGADSWCPCTAISTQCCHGADQLEGRSQR